MIDIEKIKHAALAVKENGGVDNAVLFTDLTMPSAVLELIERLKAATDQLAIDRKHRMEELENSQDRMTEYHRERVELKQKLEAAEQDAARIDFVQSLNPDENVRDAFDTAMKESK